LTLEILGAQQDPRIGQRA